MSSGPSFPFTAGETEAQRVRQFAPRLHKELEVLLGVGAALIASKVNIWGLAQHLSPKPLFSSVEKTGRRHLGTNRSRIPGTQGTTYQQSF